MALEVHDDHHCLPLPLLSLLRLLAGPLDLNSGEPERKSRLGDFSVASSKLLMLGGNSGSHWSHKGDRDMGCRRCWRGAGEGNLGSFLTAQY